MYMSLLRLQDKRLLLTFTVRDLHPPLGVRGLVGTETDDGFEFDFASDRIMLDTRTLLGKQGRVETRVLADILVQNHLSTDARGRWGRRGGSPTVMNRSRPHRLRVGR